jgi:hypothetical protein
MRLLDGQIVNESMFEACRWLKMTRAVLCEYNVGLESTCPPYSNNDEFDDVLRSLKSFSLGCKWSQEWIPHWSIPHICFDYDSNNDGSCPPTTFPQLQYYLLVWCKPGWVKNS